MTNPETPKPVDMAAVGRIARRVNLEDVSLIELSSRRKHIPRGALRLELKHFHQPRVWGPKRIEVESTYDFDVRDEDEEVAISGRAVFHLSYALQEGEPVSETGVQHFATANGAYNSWPFMRSVLHDLTGRMGTPPYTMPSLVFVPQPAKPEEKETEQSGTAEKG